MPGQPNSPAVSPRGLYPDPLRRGAPCNLPDRYTIVLRSGSRGRRADWRTNGSGSRGAWGVCRKEGLHLRMAEEQLRVLIIEDSEVTAEGLRLMIEEQPVMTVVGVMTTGQEGVRRADELKPDVILLDIHLPDLDGLQAA